MTPRDVAALLVDADATVADMTNVCEGEYSPWMTSYGTELYPDEVARNIDALATALRAALADQRRYQWLKQTDEATLCATAYRVWAACEFDTADACIDAAMTADGGGV